MRFLTAALCVLAMLINPLTAQAADDYTAADVEAFADAYAYWYESPRYPHDDLLYDALRVMRCESAQFDLNVINNRRFGRLGEVGTGQWHPRGLWPSTPQAQAGYSVRDVEANVAGVVWAISQGYGPGHWVACWRRWS